MLPYHSPPKVLDGEYGIFKNQLRPYEKLFLVTARITFRQCIRKNLIFPFVEFDTECGSNWVVLQSSDLLM